MLSFKNRDSSLNLILFENTKVKTGLHVIRVGPIAMTDVPIRRHRFGHTQKRYKTGGEHHQRRKAETG